jgi:hypothetical protein
MPREVRKLGSLICATGLVAILVSLGLSACGGRETPEVKVDDPFRTPPSPEDTELRLAAGGYEGCAGNDKVTDVTLEEDSREIRVGASVDVDQELTCELTTSATAFSVELDQPLGARRVVDISGGGSRVIWSPEKAAQFRHVRDLTVGDAEKALQSDYPNGTKHKCGRGGFDYFYCSYRDPSGKRIFINYLPRLEGGFEADTIP